MPRRIVVIQGHPDPDPARLCRALADAYAEAAGAAGHSILRFVGVAPVRTILFGAVASAARRQRWLRQMCALGAKSA